MHPPDDDNGLSFDYVFDSKIEVDDIELAFLSMEIASKIKNILQEHPQYESILLQRSNKKKTALINDIAADLSSNYNEHFQNLVTSDDVLYPTGSNLILGVIGKTIETLFDSGLQENESGIGSWTLSKSIMSSLKYYSRRIRGSTKDDAMKEQLKEWKYDLKKEQEVKKIIKEANVDSSAKNKRLGYWDRRIMFKLQKIKEKEMDINRKRKKSRKLSLHNLKEELKKTQ